MWYLNNNQYEHWVYVDDAFTNEECDSIINYADNNICFEEASIDRNLKVNAIRKNKVAWINPNNNMEWLYRKITDYIFGVNKNYWNFELQYIESLQFTRYENKDDGYRSHVDIGRNALDYRKLSFSLQLSHEDSYVGSDLIILMNENGEIAKRKKGTLNIFPSYTLHKVTPLISGKRDSLVGWVSGPRFR
jgi:PKHD-type hydroxylase